MWAAFAKATHMFSTKKKKKKKKKKKISILLDVNFNESLTNDVVSVEQLVPGCQNTLYYRPFNH